MVPFASFSRFWKKFTAGIVCTRVRGSIGFEVVMYAYWINDERVLSFDKFKTYIYNKQKNIKIIITL